MTVWRVVTALLALMFALFGCGGGADVTPGIAQSEPGDVESDQSDAADEADATEPADDADGAAAEPDTAGDGEAPASDPTPTADDRSGYTLDPVLGDDDGQSVNDLLIDVHGSTNDVASEVNRLTSFPGVPTPDGGVVIVAVSTLQEPSADADPASPATVTSSSRVSFYSAAAPEELVSLYEDAYVAWGYTNVKTTDETTDAGTSTTLSLEFGEEPGRPRSEVTITDGADTDQTLVKIDHVERNDGGDRYRELGQWAMGYAPDGAPLSKVQVTSSFDTLSSGPYNQIQVGTRWTVEGDQDVTTPLARELAASGDSASEEHSTGAYVLAGPDDRIDITGNNGSLTVDVVYSVNDLVNPF